MKKPRFRIGNSTDVAYELKKTLEQQLLYVGGLYDPLQNDTGLVIHETRQTYKKCRAILRLGRDAMGYASYYMENIYLRDMQRDLSPIRDADVQYRLFTRLSKSYREYSRYVWFKRIIETAKMNCDREMNHFLETDMASQIKNRVNSKVAQIRDYEMTGKGFEIIEGGLHRIYRQGRERGKVIFSEEVDATEVHNFRKRAKYLQYQLSYLRTISNALLKGMSNAMEQLTENLGYYNDLHHACTRIEEISDNRRISQQKRGMLLSSLREEMQKAKTASEPVYMNLYVEKPAQFISRIRTYWNSYTRGLNKKDLATV